MLEWRFNLPVEGMYWRTAGSCWREGPKNFLSNTRPRRPIWGADLRGGRMPRRDDIRKILILGSGPLGGGEGGGEGVRPPGGAPARLYARGDGRRVRLQPGGIPDDREPGTLGESRPPGPPGGGGARLGGGRARGRTGRQGGGK